MKLEWQNSNFGRYKKTLLVLTDDYDEERAIAIIVDDGLNNFDCYYTLYFEETKRIFCSFASLEEAKREAIQYVKSEAIERMKELTYIINFIER